MITGFLLESFYGIIVFLFSLFPTLALPTAVTTAVTLAFSYLNQFSFLLPVGSLLTVVGLALTFHVALLTFDFSIWVIHLIRGR